MFPKSAENGEIECVHMYIFLRLYMYSTCVCSLLKALQCSSYLVTELVNRERPCLLSVFLCLVCMYLSTGKKNLSTNKAETSLSKALKTNAPVELLRGHRSGFYPAAFRRENV